jgi:parallel beta-helix repeat protein
MRGRRLSLSVIAALLAWAAIGTIIAFRITTGGTPRASTPPIPRAARSFSHIYPVEPSGYERPAVGTHTPTVPPQDRIGHHRRVPSLTTLAADLPAGVLTHAGRRLWQLNAPIELQDSARLSVIGPVRLRLATRAFIVAETSARLVIRKTTITTAQTAPRPHKSPSEGRGFLVARSGAVLQMRHDRIIGLGHLGPQAYGITLDGASPRSAITDCVIRNDYFGVYLARMRGGRFVANRISDSIVYGIDPHTYNRHLLIADNIVRNSGVHAIILADHTSYSRVLDNRIVGAVDHGVMLYQRSTHNLIAGNTVSHTFDGIVLTDCSHNLIRNNRVAHVHRFAVRVTGQALDNTFLRNKIGPAIVGFYLYSGPTGNRLLANSFVHDYENVRIRSDAPHNVVTPHPRRSELG